jgi:hypothetical protein
MIARGREPEVAPRPLGCGRQIQTARFLSWDVEILLRLTSGSGGVIAPAPE